jgi:hypothetical protein
MMGYAGNGSYCFTYSLFMCLRHAGIDSGLTPGLLESLTGMPFGAAHFRFGDTLMFFPGSPAHEPDRGIDQALTILGWTCDDRRASDPATTAEDALTWLQEATFPALAGPANMGRLTYNPNASNLMDADHFVVVLGLEGDRVRLHDPIGFPYATLPVDMFMEAWRADGIDYGPEARSLRYVLRLNFRQVEHVERADVSARGLERARALARVTSNAPLVFSGPDAFLALAEDVCKPAADAMRDHLVWFALPLGARRCSDGAQFLAEAGAVDAAAWMARKAQGYGAAQFYAVQRQWDALAHQLEQLAHVEREYVAAIA